MRNSVRLISIAALALLAGCPGDEASHPYLGTWKLEACTSGSGCSCATPLSCPDVIDLGPDWFEEYRQGALYRSGAATYSEAQCISGERLVLDAEGGPYWCLLVSDGERLDACENVFDGHCYAFRRCLPFDGC